MTGIHPWFKNNRTDAFVHGGITYNELEDECAVCKERGYWVGFDCAHAWDLPDESLPSKYSREFNEMYRVLGLIGEHPTVKTQEFVEAECRSLCEQAYEALKKDTER